MSDDHDAREETCPDCQAGPQNMDTRVITVGKDRETGQMVTTVTWHLKDCPTHVINQILIEDSVRRAEEKTARTRKGFPAAQERLIRAVASRKLDESVLPFVEALVELVEAQGEDLGRFVPPDRWVEILNKHFPPDQ